MTWDDRQPAPEEIARARASVRVKVRRLRRQQRNRRLGLAGVSTLAVAVVALVIVAVEPGTPSQTLRVTSPSTITPSAPTTTHEPVCVQSGPTSHAVAYVTYRIGGTGSPTDVAAVDLPDGRIRWTVGVPGSDPVDAITVAPGGATVYAVVGRDDVELLPIDSASGQLGRPLGVPGPAPFQQGLAISPDGRYALIAQPGGLAVGNGRVGGQVTIVDLVRRSVSTISEGTGPSGVDFYPNPRSSTLTAFVSTAQGLQILDVSPNVILVGPTVRGSQDGEVVATRTGLVLASPHGEDLMVPASTISVANLATATVEAPIRLPRPAGPYTAPLAVGCDGTFAYVLTQGDVDRLDVVTRVVTPLDNVRATDIAESPDQSLIYGSIDAPGCLASNTSGCPTRFIWLGPQGTGRAVATTTLRGEVELIAIGPDSASRT